MLTEIRVVNPDRTDIPELDIPLFNPSRFPVSFIDGLAPVKAEVSSSRFASIPGEHFQGSGVGKRNIVLTLELLPSYSLNEDAADLRAELYSYFAPESRVNLEFITSKFTRHISGVVEAFEAPLFVQVPTVQVSILCFDPYFKAPAPRTVNATTANSGTTMITNAGSVPVGFTSTVTLSSAGSEYVVSNGPETMRASYVFPAGSVVNLSTVPMEKNLALQSGKSLLPNIAGGSAWPTLKPGVNNLVTRMTNGTGNNTVSVTFTERFAGL